MEHFGDLDSLMKADADEISAINGIGPTIGESIVTYFANQQVIKLIDELREVGVNFAYLGSRSNANPDSERSEGEYER